MFQGFGSREGYRLITEDMLAALAPIEAKYGVKFATAGGTLGTSDMLVKLKVESTDPTAVDKAAAQEFARQCRFYGLEPEDYGAEFTMGGVRYRLTAIKSSRPKYPLCAESLRDGRTYKMTTAGVVAQVVAGRAARRAAEAAAIRATPDTAKFAGTGMF
ncbi:hypothetical protein ACQKOE_07330 [Novosphingobium sp. NPDC080210]|uniref:hypothetical protein n=1 Tax=Novosphingobium sp. NPDC080210 TaxID=3390596 RepID=UPI003D013789